MSIPAKKRMDRTTSKKIRFSIVEMFRHAFRYGVYTVEFKDWHKLHVIDDLNGIKIAIDTCRAYLRKYPSRYFEELAIIDACTTRRYKDCMLIIRKPKSRINSALYAKFMDINIEPTKIESPIVKTDLILKNFKKDVLSSCILKEDLL